MQAFAACPPQDKLLRTRMLECLALCVRAWLRRHQPAPGGEPSAAAAAAAKERTERWLAKSTRPVVANLRKGNFQFPEQEARACSLIGLRTPLGTLQDVSCDADCPLPSSGR